MRAPVADRVVAFVDRHHRAVLVGSAVLFVASALSLFRLRLDMDVLGQLPSRSQAFQDYRAFLQKFGALDSLVILVAGPREPIVAFAGALAEKLEGLPEIASLRYRVDLEETRRAVLGRHRWELMTDADYAEVERRLEPAAIAERVRGLRSALAMPMSIGAKRFIVVDPLGLDEVAGLSLGRRYGDPLLRPTSEYFLAPSADALLLIARPVESAFDTIFAERLLDRVRAAEAELLGGPFAGSGIEVGHTGSYVYALADKEILQTDFAIYFLVAPLAVLAIFHVGLRTLRVLPLVIYPLLLSTVVTFALSIVLFRSLDMISVAFAGIFSGLGIGSTIYFYALLREKTAGGDPLDRGAIREGIASTLREIGVANVVASTTTAAAFFVIGLSDFTGVSQLGIMTGIGMLLNIVATFVLLPAMVIAWGRRAIPAGTAAPDRLADAYGRLAVRLAGRHRVVLATGAVAVALAIGALPRVRLDTDFTHLRPGGGEAERVEQTIQERFGRFDARGIVLTRGRNLEEALERAEAVAERLEAYRTEDLVSSYSTLTAFLPSKQTQARRHARFASLPRAAAAAAFREAAEQAGFAPGAFDAFLADLRTAERPAEEPTTEALAPLREQHLREIGGETWLVTYFVPNPGVALADLRARLAADLPPSQDVVTGRELVEAEFHRLLSRELVWFLFGALGLNFLLVWLAERRVGRSCAVLAPTLAALVLYLGLVGALDLPIDPVNLIVIPMLIGLGVDDSVYLLAHIRHGGGVGAGSRRGALPLLLAVGTTVVGLGSLGLSRFPALSRLGWLAALGLTLCVAGALLLVPALYGARALGDGEESRNRSE